MTLAKLKQDGYTPDSRKPIGEVWIIEEVCEGDCWRVVDAHPSKESAEIELKMQGLLFDTNNYRIVRYVPGDN